MYLFKASQVASIADILSPCSLPRNKMSMLLWPHRPVPSQFPPEDFQAVTFLNVGGESHA